MMDLEKAYNKIDNLCCFNDVAMQHMRSEAKRGINIPVEDFDFYKAYKETNEDDDFCKDTDEMVESLETIKNLVDLQKELGCPLAIVGRLLLHKERYIYTVEKSKLTGEYFMDKHKIVGMSEFGVCILTTNYILKTEPKYYKWNEYKKTWWLREDKSE